MNHKNSSKGNLWVFFRKFCCELLGIEEVRGGITRGCQRGECGKNQHGIYICISIKVIAQLAHLFVDCREASAFNALSDKVGQFQDMH